MAGTLPVRQIWTKPVLLRRVRQLDVDGRVVVRERTAVRAGDVVARGQRRFSPLVVPVAQQLKLDDPSLDRVLVRRVGDVVQKGEVIARTRGPLGLGGRACASPATGTLENGARGRGEVLIVPLPEEVELVAHFPGTVASVLPTRGVVIEFTAVGIQGAIGRPGEGGGRIRVLAAPEQEIPATRITERLAGAVVVGGTIGLPGLRRAAEVGVGGVVVGSLRAAAFEAQLADEHGVPLIVTEGFGPKGMSERCYELLRKSEGQEARLWGGGDDDDLPEVVVPLEDVPAIKVRPPALELGAAVRIVAGRHAFAVGQVAAVGAAPLRFPSGLVSPWIDVALEDGSQARVPVGNVELVG